MKRELHAGRCAGGPFDGLVGESRRDSGFVAVDEPAGQVWMYERTAEGTYECRQEVPMPLPARGPDRHRWVDEVRAAGYDIRAVETDSGG